MNANPSERNLEKKCEWAIHKGKFQVKDLILCVKPKYCEEKTKSSYDSRIFYCGVYLKLGGKWK